MRTFVEIVNDGVASGQIDPSHLLHEITTQPLAMLLLTAAQEANNELTKLYLPGDLEYASTVNFVQEYALLAKRRAILQEILALRQHLMKMLMPEAESTEIETRGE